MIYSTGRDITFVILAIMSSLAIFSHYVFLAGIFFVLTIVYVIYEYDISEYIKNA